MAAPDTAHARAGDSDCTGYTLIELLTILAVLGIVTALAAPRIDFQRFQLEGSMQSVASIFMTAQRKAVQEQHSVVVAFDVAGSRLRIHSDQDNDLLVDAGESIRFESLGEGVRFGSGGAPPFFSGTDPVSFTVRQDGMPAVVFSRNGAASEEGGFYLTSLRAVANPEYSRDTRVLRIDRSTGRASWFHLENTHWQRDF